MTGIKIFTLQSAQVLHVINHTNSREQENQKQAVLFIYYINIIDSHAYHLLILNHQLRPKTAHSQIPKL